MAKRGRKKKLKLKFNMRKETARSVLAVLLILCACIILISFLAGGYAGNSVIQRYVLYVFGYSQIVLVPILIIAGLLLLNTVKWRFVELRVLFGLFLMLFGLSGLLHTFYSEEKSLEAAQAGNGGGLLGYLIATNIKDLISIYGAVLVFFAALVVAILIISDKGMDEMVNSIKALSLNSKFKRGKKREDEEGELQIDAASGEHDIFATHEEATTEIQPSFKIIPSKAEPYGNDSQTLPVNDGNLVTSLVPNLPYSDKVWELPPLDLLSDPPNTPVDRGDVKQRGRIIEETLASFGINAKIKDYRFGPSVTQYALEAESGTKITKIANLQYDLALALASPTGSVRIEAPIPGKSLIGIEVPNNNRVPVNFKEMITSESMKALKSKIGIALGLDVGGQPISHNIAKMPHLLIAGATGSGKSIFIHNIMFSILFRATPQECKFILIDPKRVELVHYNDIPHLLTPVVTDIEKAPSVFKWAVSEMERRYKLLETAKVRNIEAYNEKSGFQALPYIMIIVDELGEIMVTDPQAVEKSIIRLAQLARATGIHLVLAMQRPSTNIITGLIKANIPCRIAFNVTSQVDSRVIIDQPGAEKLLGMGDMLFVPPDDSKPIRIQGAMVSDKEISNLVNYLKSRGIEPEYKEGIFDMQEKTRSITVGGESTDQLFDEAVDVITNEGKASASLLQRRLAIGYSRAARILDEMEAKGVVGPAKGSKPRKILIETSVPQIDEDYEE